MGGRVGGRDIVIVVVIIRPTKGDNVGERGGQGDNKGNCGRGGCLVDVIIERHGQRLGGKGGRGMTSTAMA